MAGRFQIRARGSIVGPVLALLFAFAMAPGAARAANYTWTGGGDGTSWENGANWGSASYPNNVNDVANINNAAAQASGTITTAASHTIQTLRMAPAVTLSLGANDLTVRRNIVVSDLGNGVARITGSGRVISSSDTSLLRAVDGANDWLEIDKFEVNDSGAGTTLTLETGDTVRVLVQFSFVSSGNFIVQASSRFAIPGGTVPVGSTLTTQAATLEVSGAFSVAGIWVQNAADIILFTAYASASSSINAGTNPTVLRNVEIGTGVDAPTLTPTVDLSVNGNWTVRSGATFSGGTKKVTFPAANTLSGSGTSRFNNTDFTSTHTLAAGTPIAATGTLAILGGATLTASGATQNVITIDGGTFSRTGTFNQGISKVVFAGATPGMPTSATTFYDLEIAATTSALAGADYTIGRNWISTSAVYGAGSYTVTFAGAAGGYSGSAKTTFGTAVVSGAGNVLTLDTGDTARVSTLTVASGASLALSGNCRLEVAVSLSVNGNLTASGSTPTLTDTGSDFAFTVAGGAGTTLSVSQLAVQNPDNSGLRIDALPAVLFALNNVAFTNDDGTATGTYLNFNFAVSGGPYVLSGLSFDANCQYSVRTAAGSSANAINLQGPGGAKGDEPYENDGDAGVVSPGSIVWAKKIWTNGTGDGLWSTPGNWSPSGAPGSTEAVLIPDNASHVPAGGPTIDNLASPVTVGSLRVEDGGTVVTTGNNPTLTVSGTMAIDSDLGAGSPGSFDFRGTGNLTLSGAVTNGGTLTIGNSGTVSFGGSVTNQAGATLLVKSGPASVGVTGSIANQGTLDLADGANPDYGGTVSVSGNFTNGGSATFLPGTAGTFLFNGATGSIDAGGDPFGNLTVSGTSTYTATTSLATSGLLDVNGVLKIQAALTMTGTFDASAGTIEYSGSTAQTVSVPPGGVGYRNLSIANASGATMGGSFGVAGTLLVNSGALFKGGTGNTLTLSGTWDNRGSFDAGDLVLSTSGTPTIGGTVVTTFASVTVSPGSTLSVGAIGTFRVSGTFTNNHATDGFDETGKTVEFTGSPSTIAGSLVTTFDNLTITGTLQLSGVTQVRVRNQWTNNGSFTPGTSTVVFAGVSAGDQGRIAGSSATTFAQLDLVNSGIAPTLVLDGTDAVTVTALFTVQAGETFRMEGQSVLRLGTGMVVDGAGASFVATGDKPTLTDTGADFSFKVRGGGTIDLDGCVFQNPDNSGLDIEATAGAAFDLDTVDFKNDDGAATGSYLTIRRAAIPTGTYVFTSCSFDASCQYNVTATDPGSANNAISLPGWSGAKGGEAYDSDPGDPSPSIVEWPNKVWDGSTDNLWSRAANWTPAVVPGTNDRVLVDFNDPSYVANTPLYNLGAAGVTIAALHISDGSTLDSSTGVRSLKITGVVEIEPDGGAGSPGTLMWKCTSDPARGGFDAGGLVTNEGYFYIEAGNPLIVDFRAGFVNKGTFSNRNTGSGFAALAAANGGFTIQGDLDNQGPFNPFASQGVTERLEVRGSWLNSASGTFLTAAQDALDQVVLTAGTDASPATIQSNGGAFVNLSIPAGAVYRATDDLTIGTASQAGRLRVDGKLILAGGLSFVNAATVFETGTGTIEFAGTSPQTIPAPPNGAGGSNPYFHLGTSNTSGSGATLGANMTVNGNLTIKPGGKLSGSTRTLTLAGDWTNDGTFSAGTSTVVASGTPSTVRGSVLTRFANLSIDTGDSLAISTTTSPANSVAVDGTWSNGGTFTAGSSTVFFGGTSSQVNGSQVTTFNHLTVETGATLSVGAVQIVNVNGTWTQDGTFSAGSSIVRFTSAAGAIAGTSATFNVVQVQSGATLTLDGTDSMRVTGAVLPGAPDAVGFLVRAGGTLVLTGTPTLRLGQGISIGRSATPGGTFSASGGTVTDTGANYSFDVYGGTVAISALALDRPDANGIRVNDSGSYGCDFDNVNFTGGNPTTGIYVNLRYSSIPASTFVFSGCSFDANCRFNVHTEAGASNGAVTMTGFSGARGTKDYEDDRGAGESSPPNGDSTGSILWANYRWTNGTGNGLWSGPGNWFPVGPPPSTASVLIPDDTSHVPTGGPTLNMSTTVGALTMADNSTFQTDGGARNLTVTGQLALQSLGSPASFSFAGSGNLTVGGVLDDAGSLSWSSTGSATFSGDATVQSGGTFRVASGLAAGDIRFGGSVTNSGTFDLTDGGNPDYDGTIRVLGSWTNGALALFDAGTASTVAFGNTTGSGTGTIQSAGDPFWGLRVETNFTYTASDDLTVGGTLDVNGVLSLAAGVSMSGTFDATAGVVSYAGTSPQTVVVPPGGPTTTSTSPTPRWPSRPWGGASRSGTSRSSRTRRSRAPRRP
ncbi:MAG: hypothetical protein HY720_10820 [Planctomycetes bacterium]|nr:hypothetical protein [Planctomycetota bacterium]